LKLKHCGLLEEMRPQKAAYAAQAQQAAVDLRKRIVALLFEMAKRGVLNPLSMSGLILQQAQSYLERLEAIEQVERPRVLNWLATLGEADDAMGLVAPARAALRTTVDAWEKLLQWRANFGDMMSMPLVKLQLRTDRLQTELAEYDAAFGQMRMADEVAPAIEATYPELDMLAIDGLNVILVRLQAELDEWRRALPIVQKLIHPNMHSAQWQRVFGILPSTADKSAPEAASAPAEAAGFASPSIKPTNNKADGNGLAERVPSQRITLSTIWPHLEATAAIIESVHQKTLVKHDPKPKRKGRPHSGIGRRSSK